MYRWHFQVKGQGHMGRSNFQPCLLHGSLVAYAIEQTVMSLVRYQFRDWAIMLNCDFELGVLGNIKVDCVPFHIHSFVSMHLKFSLYNTHVIRYVIQFFKIIFENVNFERMFWIVHFSSCDDKVLGVFCEFIAWFMLELRHLLLVPHICVSELGQHWFR